MSDEQDDHDPQCDTELPIDRPRPGDASLYDQLHMQPDAVPDADRRRPLPLGPLRRGVREVGFALITAGVVVLLFVGYQLWGTGFAERSSQSKLRKEFNAQLSTVPPTTSTTRGSAVSPATTIPAPTAVPVSAPTGEAIAHLQIPKIAVDKFIVDGTSVTQLRKGPGHYGGTALPGEPGNAAIAGHRTTYGAPFYRLNELQAGDDIFITTRAGRFHYVVQASTVVKPSDVAVLDQTTDNRLTLTTCNPRFSAATRLVVVSRLTQPPTQPTPTTVPAAAASSPVSLPAASNSLGAGDHRAWPPTILFGAIALALWVAVRIVAARARRRGWLAFVVGIPVCAVPLWFVFENVIRLLPANI